MSWVRTDDNIIDHKKLMRTEFPALGLAQYQAGLCYCSRNLTDGFIPRAKATCLLPISGLARQDSGQPITWDEINADLVRCGLWEIVEDGYEVHDYLDFQSSSSEVIADRRLLHENKVRAGRIGAAKRWHNSTDIAGAIADAKQTHSVPVPVPKTKDQETCSPLRDEPASEPVAEFDAFWAEYPRKSDKGHARKAFNGALKKASFETIMVGLRRYEFDHRKLDGRSVIPLPATWLNGERWGDELPATNEGTPRAPGELDERLQWELDHLVIPKG